VYFHRQCAHHLARAVVFVEPGGAERAHGDFGGADAAAGAAGADCGSAGLALALALGSKLELSLEGQALMAVPPANVWAGSGGPAKTGQPTVLVLLGLAVLP